MLYTNGNSWGEGEHRSTLPPPHACLALCTPPGGPPHHGSRAGYGEPQQEDLPRPATRRAALMVGMEPVRPEEEAHDTTERFAGPGFSLPGAESHTGRTPRAAAPELAAAVPRECLWRGLIVGLGGPHARIVRLLPPLTITGEQATAVLDRLAGALRAAAGRGDAPARCHTRVPFARAPRRPGSGRPGA
jgi:hypothetical protein